MSRHFARLIGGAMLAASVSAAWASGQAAEAPIRFDISRFDVAGDVFLGQATVDATLKSLTGKSRDFGDIQRAIEALEAAYHKQGYKLVTVRVPEQELNSGVVRLQVVSARLGRVAVSGNRHFDEANVRRSLPTLVPGQSPNLDKVSANLKLANEHPARKISMKLRSADDGDDVDAQLEVSDQKPWTVRLNLDNTGSAATGKTHAGVVLQHANLWGRDHLATFQYTTTAEKPSQVSVYGLGYHIPLYELGHSLDLFASYSNVDSGTVTAGALNLSVSGKGAMYGARYNQILARRGELEHRLIYGADWKAYRNAVLFAGQNIAKDITVHPLSVEYLATQTLASAQLSASLALVHNLPGGDKGGSTDFDAARKGAKAGYTIVRFAGAYTQALGRDWQVRMLANGQLSGDALVPGEQFGSGGATSVRGFSERALAADSGLTVNAELYSPNLAGNGNWQARALAFYDAAHGTRNKVQIGEAESLSIGSAGLGLRLVRGEAVSVQFDWGRVLNGGAVGADGKNKVHVRIGLAY